MRTIHYRLTVGTALVSMTVAAVSARRSNCCTFVPNKQRLGRPDTIDCPGKVSFCTFVSKINEDFPSIKQSFTENRKPTDGPSGDFPDEPMSSSTRQTYPSQNNRNDEKSFLGSWKKEFDGLFQKRLPPLQVDDTNLLLYDVALFLNLVVSISFWVVHRMQVDFVALAFNEGSLLSICWIIAGLWHGAFLDSAIDGHQRPQYFVGEDDSASESSQSEKDNTPFWEMPTLSTGGPTAAGLLAVNTFINTISLRLIMALVVAVAEHRAVFDDPLEQLIPYEVGFGLILMSAWRSIHSAFVPRI